MAEEWSPWTPIVRVTDARASAAFYRDALDFTIDWEHRFEEGWPLYVSVSRPPLFLHLSEHGDGEIHLANLYVRVADVDAVHRLIVERGFTPESEPVDQSYGMRDFCLIDPDGHRLTIGSLAGYPTELHKEPETPA